MNSDEQRQEFCDLLAAMTPELQRVSVVLLQAVWGKGARRDTLRGVLAYLGAMTDGELKGLLTTLESEGWAA
jgi:hypothetical protein